MPGISTANFHTNNMKRFTVTTPAKTHAQATKLDKRRQAVQSLVDRYNTDPEFGETMAHLTGALYLAIACADNCTWEIDKLTTNILIPAELRKCIKDMTTCMQRTIRAEERNKLLACTPKGKSVQVSRERVPATGKRHLRHQSRQHVHRP